jgi:hypothetical protein
MLIHSAEITGSVQFNNTDVSGITNVSGFATTASVDAVIIKTGSFATTSSVNELQSKTGSYATTSSVNELQSKTGSYTSTSSFGTYTASNDLTNATQSTRLSTIESVTGSYTSTSSFDAYSSSINTFTSSATTRLNTIESVTGSFASTSSVNNLQSVTGSYASTGSNQFNGNQSISGSIVSNGTITAQTLVVQTVTSSIEFVTGSTRNGSLAANTHQFTGSVLMSGSLNVGGASTFSSGITSNSTLATYLTNGTVLLRDNGASQVEVNIRHTNSRNGVISFTQDGVADRWAIGTKPSDGTLYFSSNFDLSSPKVVITSTGNVGIGASTSPTYKLEASTAGGSERIRVGTLQNNNNTATFEAITSAGLSTATSGWIRAVYGGGLALGTSTYTKSGGDSGNFANLSAESATTGMVVESNNNVSFAKAQKHTSNLWHVIPFGVQKGNGAGSADSRTILEITSDAFNEYFIHINYGARIQNVSDATTNISSRMYGVNRFNGGAVAVTDSAIMAGSSGTINTHAPITAVASTSTKVIVKVDFSSSGAAASFVWGEIRIFSWEGITPIIVNNGW